MISLLGSTSHPSVSRSSSRCSFLAKCWGSGTLYLWMKKSLGLPASMGHESAVKRCLTLSRGRPTLSELVPSRWFVVPRLMMQQTKPSPSKFSLCVTIPLRAERVSSKLSHLWRSTLKCRALNVCSNTSEWIRKEEPEFKFHYEIKTIKSWMKNTTRQIKFYLSVIHVTTFSTFALL